MALYFSSARRARRTAIIAVVAALVAFTLGWAFGRQQVPSVTSQVASVQADAADIAIGVERLDIEYEQTLTSGGGDSVASGVIAPLDELRTTLQQTMDRAPWLAGSQRSALLDSLAEVRSAAASTVTLDQFRMLTEQTGSAVRQAFGIADSSN